MHNTDSGGRLDLSLLSSSPIEALIEMASARQVHLSTPITRPEVIQKILESVPHKTDMVSEGCFDLMEGGFGFLRGSASSFQPSSTDVYVSPSQVKRFKLQRGDQVRGIVRPPRDSERYFALLRVEELNGLSPHSPRRAFTFDEMTPCHPQRRLLLEHSPYELNTRIIDLFCPLGFGQRALIVAPPKTGKTTLLQKIAAAISALHPDVHLMTLLIDERPEELTEMRSMVRGEVVGSCFDEPARRHQQVAEFTLERAKRLVESGHDVIILLDSITRLARAYNKTVSSGKLLSGGVDVAALEEPKRLFGAARNMREGGSLTILATALVDTGSRADEVIYEEFKGTGNAEIYLSRTLMERRCFPTIDAPKSSTRREELLRDQDELQAIWAYRRLMQEQHTLTESTDRLHKLLKLNPDNQTLIESIESIRELS
jgi:transcription termination factor Rho